MKKHPTTCLEICQRHGYKQDRKHGTDRLPNDTTESSSGKTENFANLMQSQRKLEIPSLISSERVMQQLNGKRKLS